MNDEEERRNDASLPSPQGLPEGVDQAYPEYRGRGDGQDHSQFGEAKDLAEQGGGDQPGDPVGDVIACDSSVIQDESDVASEDLVVCEPEAAEVEKSQPQAQSHQAGDPGKVDPVQEGLPLSLHFEALTSHISPDLGDHASH